MIDPIQGIKMRRAVFRSSESQRRETLRETQKAQETDKDYKGAAETAKKITDSIKKEQKQYGG